MRSSLHLLFFAIVLFGGAWPITKAAVSDACPMWFGFGRAALATIAAGLLLAVLRRLHLPKREDLPTVFAVGILQLGGFFVLAHAAVALVEAGRTAIISAVVTYWLIPLSMLVMGEQVSGRRWMAALLGLGGIMVLAGPWAVDWTAPGQLAGHGMLIVAALLWSIAIIVTRRFPPKSPMFDLLPWAFSIGALVILPFALMSPRVPAIGPSAWPYLLYIGLIVAPIGTWCVVEVGRRLPGAVASVAFLLVPAFGVFVSTLWLGEPFGWDMMLGGGLIVGSVVLAASE
ncbi:MAG: DMT family transporter [Roseomonas sp.]|nr:DMT family transporter [Roseomonas sp.]